MSVRKWCTDSGIKTSQYYYWLRVLRNESLALIPKKTQLEKPSFATLKVSNTSSLDIVDEGICAIVRTNNFSVEIKNGANPNTRENILQILNSLC